MNGGRQKRGMVAGRIIGRIQSAARSPPGVRGAMEGRGGATSSSAWTSEACSTSVGVAEAASSSDARIRTSNWRRSDCDGVGGRGEGIALVL